MAFIDQNTFGYLNWKSVTPAELANHLIDRTIIRVDVLGDKPGVPADGVVLYLRDYFGNETALKVNASEFDADSELPVIFSTARVGE